LVFFFLFCAFVSSAQNTIGGLSKTVPEAEVDRQSKFLEAERERLLGHWDKAIGRYKRFTYENPDVDAGWYGLARSYEATEDFANALDASGKALALAPDNPWYLVLQAELFETTGRAKDAAKIYESLSKSYPKDLDYLRHLAHLSLLADDPKGSLKALDRLEALQGISEETSGKKQVIYEAMGDVKKAAAELQKLVDTYPARVEYRHHLAQFYESTRNTEAARRVYEDILRRYPNDPLAKLGVMQKTKANTDIGFLESLKPLFANPQVSIDAKLKEVLPYLSKSNAADADAGLRETLLALGTLLEQAHPIDPKAWSFSGAVLYQMNRRDEALEKYKQCLRLNPNVFGAWDNALSILAEQQNFEEMLRIAEQAMEAFPNQAKAYYYYGIAATEKGRYDDAIPQLQQALIMIGNMPLRLDILDQLGVAQLRKKDLPAAAITFEQAIAKGGDKHPGVLEHYGDLLFQRGDKTAAAANWQKAYDLSKNPAILQKIKGI